MIDRMAFYQSFCEKLKEGICFYADWEGKGALIFCGLNLCVSAPLREKLFFAGIFNPPKRVGSPLL